MKSSTLNEPKLDKQNLKTSLIVGLFFAFNICIFAPLEMYLSNIDDFWFSFRFFVPGCILLAIALFAGSVLLGMLFKGNHFKRYISLVFGGALALYVQGNFMNNFYGELDGTHIIWQDFLGRGILGICIWLVILILPFVLLWKFEGIHKKVVKFVPLMIIGVQALTLVTLFLTVDFHKDSLATAYTDVDNFKLSKNENVIVFVLDTYDSTVFSEQLERTPQYYDDFKDFTFYKNTASLFQYTAQSIPQILTGIQSKNELPIADYTEKAYSESIFFPLLEEHGYESSIYTFETLMPKSTPATVTNTRLVELGAKSPIRLWYLTMKLMFYRYAPQPLKPIAEEYFSHSFSTQRKSSTSTEMYNGSNIDFFNSINESQWILADANQFKFYHLDGIHVPFTTDEFLNEIPIADSSIYMEAEGSLLLLNTYIDKLKAIGAYDSSTIFILADHGAPGYSLKQKPLLMVKYANETNDALQISAAPLSFADLMPTFATIVSGNHDYGKTIFDYSPDDIRERFFYLSDFSAPHDTGYYSDFVEYSVGSDLDAIAKTGTAYGRGQVYAVNDAFGVSADIIYQFGLKKEINKLFDIGAFTHRVAIFKTDFIFVTNPLRLSFRPDASLAGDIQIDIAYLEPVSDRQRVTVTSGDVVVHEGEYSDETGIISFVVPRETMSGDGKVSLSFDLPDAGFNPGSDPTSATVKHSFKFSTVTFSNP